jgi:hypothetical protein
MLNDAEMFDRMKNGWRAGIPDGTICGNGSTMANTANIRKWLPKIIAQYGIKRICDAGAGDMHWIKRVELGCEYLPFDLIPRDESIKQIDITAKRLPKCDAVLCRMVLNHLDQERIQMALAQFKKAARYLIVTQFDGDKLPQRSPQFTRLDLRREPYLLGELLARIQDGSEDICSLAIFDLRT